MWRPIVVFPLIVFAIVCGYAPVLWILNSTEPTCPGDISGWTAVPFGTTASALTWLAAVVLGRPPWRCAPTWLVVSSVPIAVGGFVVATSVMNFVDCPIVNERRSDPRRTFSPFLRYLYEHASPAGCLGRARDSC